MSWLVIFLAGVVIGLIPFVVLLIVLIKLLKKGP